MAIRPVAPSIISAGCHPAMPISSCANGISVNCPNEPPALTMPFAMPCLAAGIQRLAADISSAGPIAPAPMADNTPISRISASDDCASGVRAVPAATSSAPAIITGRGPQRSATAPAAGWATPHINCPTANARLMLA